ncbi:hypothetical protein [Thalassotalea aquiviva]|uniref:hypothetical protein n=1 Tax=Thalassotalea aquiviva TaxID=3242415 RepID=UPI003529DCD0
MAFKYLLSLFFIFIVLGCSSSPTIHLNKRYLDNKAAKAIKSELKQLGFNVEENQLPYPEEITSTSIIYSPFVRDSEIIEKVEHTLNTFGYPLQSINALVSSNHWYTKNSIGLFVVPEHTQPHQGYHVRDLAKRYISTNCAIEIALELKSNGIFHYIEHGQTKLKGVWRTTGYPYILLEKQTPYLSYYYEVGHAQSNDLIGKVNITSLEPISNDNRIQKCPVSFGVRD